MSKHAVAVVVRTPGGIPLVRDPKKPAPIYWKFPGGRGGPEETAEEVAIREVQEEIGVSPQRNDLKVIHREDKGDHLLTIFLVDIPLRVVTRHRGDEGEEVRYFSPSELVDCPDFFPNHRKVWKMLGNVTLIAQEHHLDASHAPSRTEWTLSPAIPVIQSSKDCGMFLRRVESAAMETRPRLGCRGLIIKESLEPLRGELDVPARVPHFTMSEVGLDEAEVGAALGQVVAARSAGREWGWMFKCLRPARSAARSSMSCTVREPRGEPRSEVKT